MDLKFYLNKFLKVDNIEKYTLKTLITLRSRYEDFLEQSEGNDPDFPAINFGSKGKKIKGKNIIELDDNEDYKDNSIKGMIYSKKKKNTDLSNLMNLTK